MNKIYITFNHFTVIYSLLIEKTKENQCNDKTIIYYYGSKPIENFKDAQIEIVKFSPPAFSQQRNLKNVWEKRQRYKFYQIVTDNIKETLMKTNTQELFIYKDNSLIEATIIEYIQRKKTSCSVNLIEEGLGLYQKNRYHVENKLKNLAKKTLSFYYGLSSYPFSRQPQGKHTGVDKIYCHYPEKIIKKSCFLIKLKDDFCINSVQDVCQTMYPGFVEKMKQIHPQFVFLTQPLTSLIGVNSKSYQNKIQEIFSCIDEKETILIKKHPMDREDYHGVLRKNVIVLDEYLNNIPFQLMYPVLGYPSTLSFYSSVSIYLNHNSDFILYKLLNNKRVNEIVEGIKDIVCESYVCSSISDLRRVLKGVQ